MWQLRWTTWYIVYAAMIAARNYSSKHAHWDMTAAGNYSAKHTHWGSWLVNPKGGTFGTFWVAKGIQFYFVPSTLLPSHICSDSDSELMTRELSQANLQTDWNIGTTYILVSSHLTNGTLMKTKRHIDRAAVSFTNTLCLSPWLTTDKTKSKGTQPIQALSVEMIHKKKTKWQTHHSSKLRPELSEATKCLWKAVNDKKIMRNYLRGLPLTANNEYFLWKVSKNVNRPKQHFPPLPDWARNDVGKGAAHATHIGKVQ